MKAYIKRYFVPVLAGFIAALVTWIVGYEINDWQCWFLIIVIITMSWYIIPLHKKISGEK